MKKQITKLGFTLIELLVVITIIGILATGATTIYTSQIQKARDSNRITDIKALEWAMEQAYSDASIYPTHVKWNTTCDPQWVTDAGDTKFWVWCLKTLEYINKFPQDKKLDSQATNTWSSSNSEYLWYAYDVSESISHVPLQTFEVSTAFEAKASLTSKARDSIDWWNNPLRYEAWNNIAVIKTDFSSASDVKTDCTYTAANKWLSITKSCAN